MKGISSVFLTKIFNFHHCAQIRAGFGIFIVATFIHQNGILKACGGKNENLIYHLKETGKKSLLQENDTIYGARSK